MAKKPAKKAAKKTASKAVSKARKAPAKKSSAVKRAPRKRTAVPRVAVQRVVGVRLNRDEKNALRKQLQVNLKSEKDPRKRLAMRREAAPLLK